MTRTMVAFVSAATVLFMLPPLAANGAQMYRGTSELGTVRLDIVSDFNDWEWQFNVTPARNREVFSLHVSGLLGDVTDTGEYEDFQRPRRWTANTVAANHEINFRTASAVDAIGGLLNPTGSFAFDSDYDSVRPSFKLHLDDQRGRLFLVDLTEVPVPAALPLFLSAALGLAGWRALAKRRYQG